MLRMRFTCSLDPTEISIQLQDRSVSCFLVDHATPLVKVFTDLGDRKSVHRGNGFC